MLYPGSYAHITPSFVYSYVVYNDTYKKLESYYKSKEILDYIQKQKFYLEEAKFYYIQNDFYDKLPLEENFFDLLISQYSGFISRACMKYLKIGGLLIANNSHGDASMASILPEYKFIAVINRYGKKFTHSTKNLDSYFIPKKPKEITEKSLGKRGRGIGYTKYATDYVFRRIK
ncbi:MAG: hypothetical protein ACTSVU_01215 [Promethearchaeota archaeon]